MSRITTSTGTVVKRAKNHRLMEFWINEHQPYYMVKNPDCEYTMLAAVNRKQAIKQFFKELEK